MSEEKHFAKKKAVEKSAMVAATLADVIPLSAFEETTFEAREEALFANRLKEWWDEFWHGFALTVARGGKRR